MLDLDPLAPRTPRLPHRRLGALTQVAASTPLHMTFVVIAAVIGNTSARDVAPDSAPDRAVELAQAFTALAGQYPHRA